MLWAGGVCEKKTPQANNMDQKFCYNNYLNFRSLKSADSVRQQLLRIFKRLGLELNSTPFEDRRYYDNIKRAILSGFFMQVAHKERSGGYLTVKDNQIVSVRCALPLPLPGHSPTSWRRLLFLCAGAARCCLTPH